LPYQDDWTLSIVDKMGRIIFTKNSSDLIPVFDTKKLPAGVYYLKIKNSDKEEISRKVVVR